MTPRLRYGALLALLLGAVPAIPAADPAPSPKPPDPSPVVAPLTITGASGPVLDGYAELTTNAGPTDSVRWAVKPKPKKLTHTATGLIFSGVEGTTYTVTATLVNFDTKRFDQAEVDVTFGTPKPPPVPPTPVPPGPQPGPPVPNGKVAKFVVVEDTSKAGQFRGDILGSPAVQAYYKSAGLTHLLISSGATTDPASVAGKWQAAAAGKELPWLFTLDASGVTLAQGKCPTTSPTDFVTAIGGSPVHEDGDRAMGNIDTEDWKPRLKWNLFGASPNVPLIPRAQWKETSLANFLPPVYDQDGIGQCNPCASCNVLEVARAVAGLPYKHLSGGDLYARINGGRDNGSMLEDALAELIANGVATTDTVPYLWDRGRPRTDAATVAERKLYRITEAYLCPDFDAVASALQQGFVCDVGIQWFPNFKPDRDGWLPTRGSGRPGGHAILVYALVKKADGTWGVKMRNTWGGSWGIGGNANIPESLFGRSIGGFYAARSVVMTPDVVFPAPKLSLRPFDRRSEPAFALSF